MRDGGYKRHPLVELFTEPDRFVARVRDYAGDLIATATPWLALAVAVLLLAGVALAFARYLRARRLADGARRIRILAPPEVDASGALTLWMGLHAVLRPAWRRFLSGQPHLAWEVVAEPDTISFSLWVPRAIPPGLVERAVESAWPGAKTEIEADVAFPEAVGETAATELTLAEPDWFPIGSELDTEPLRLALGSMIALDDGELAVIQVLARPATSAARYRLLRAARHLKRAQPQALPFWASGAGARQVSGTRPAMDPTVDPDVRAILAKASSPLWRCAVRVAVTSPRRPQARGKIHALAGAFAVFEGRNGFRRRRTLGGPRRLRDRGLAGGYLLSVPELAQIAALPAEAIPGLDRARARTLAPPRELPKEGIVLGLSDHTSAARPVALSVEDARHHIHVMGETGTGKSTLIARMVLADASAGRAAVVIDPKGDLVNAIIARLPRGAENRTCLLDPDDHNYAVGLNVLAGDDADLVVDHVLSVFRRIYESSWGPRTDDIMRAACLTLTQIPGATMAEVMLLLTNHEWRRQLRNQRSELFDTGHLGSFWDWYEHLGDPSQHNAPLMNKLRAFLLRAPVRAIVGQDKPKLDIPALIDEGGLLLVRIPKGTLGEGTSRILGAFVVARVWQACMKRAEQEESARAPVGLYVDEMHNYLALPRSFEDMLAEARGYGLSLVLAHQHLGQLPRDMRTALGANARNKILFTCSPEDAVALESHFRPYLTDHDLSNLGAYQAACRPSLGGGHGPAFTFTTTALKDAEAGRSAAVRRESASRFAESRRAVEADISQRHGAITAPSDSQSVPQSVPRPASQSPSRSRLGHPRDCKRAGEAG
ncbi:MAG: type IV secretion system DNA-binding domain-containing protein [Gemmatimonas sp.]|nr:type IV secretion system DNA-binding domain-containing protein [Gemmatimonas sp.]